MVDGVSLETVSEMTPPSWVGITGSDILLSVVTFLRSKQTPAQRRVLRIDETVEFR